MFYYNFKITYSDCVKHDKRENTQITHCTYFSARKRIKLHAEDVC